MAIVKYNAFGEISKIRLDKRRTMELENTGYTKLGEDYWVIKLDDDYFVAKNIEYDELLLNCEDEKQ